MSYYIIHIFKTTLHPPRFRETQCLLSVVCCPLSAVCCPLSVVLPSAICCLLSAVWGDIHRDPYHEKCSISPYKSAIVRCHFLPATCSRRLLPATCYLLTSPSQHQQLLLHVARCQVTGRAAGTP